MTKPIRSYLKKVFSPDIGVEPSSQVLDILEYAGRRSRLKTGRLDSRLRVHVPSDSRREISTENPNFEKASGPNIF